MVIGLMVIGLMVIGFAGVGELVGVRESVGVRIGRQHRGSDGRCQGQRLGAAPDVIGPGDHVHAQVAVADRTGEQRHEFPEGPEQPEGHEHHQ